MILICTSHYMFNWFTGEVCVSLLTGEVYIDVDPDVIVYADFDEFFVLPIELLSD